MLSIGAALSVSSTIAAAPSAIAPPMAQERADCMRPVYATDQLVCADTALSRLDAEMAERATRVGQGTGWPASPYFESQQAWFKRRSLCAFQPDHRGCTAAAYRARIEELDAVLDPPSGRYPLRCARGGLSRISSPTPAGVRVLFDTAGLLLAVALPAKADPWQPFLAYGGPDRRLLLKRAGAPKAVTCHVTDHSG